MCGIVGAIAQRDILSILLEGLRRLEYRGYDSAGVALLNEGAIHRTRAVGKVKQLEEALSETAQLGKVGISHTRWATHGIASEANAHPHLSHDDIAVVHNGIITNFESIKQNLIKAGYKFFSDTDTEVVVHLIHSFRQQGFVLIEAVQAAVQQCEGAYALGVIDRHNPDELICARKGSPLVIGIGAGENYIASDQLALLQVTDRFMFLEEGDTAKLSLHEVKVWDAQGCEVERKVAVYDYADHGADKGEFRHYMAKEIHEQPMVVANILTKNQHPDNHLDALLTPQALDCIKHAQHITIVACGTSYYAGRVAGYWIEELANIACHVEVASEYRYRKSVTPPKTLFVTLSQSGETADTLAALRHVDKSSLVGTLTICNVPSSTMVRESDFVLPTQAGPEIGVASTKAFTSQLLALLQLTLLLSKHHYPSLAEDLSDSLNKLPSLFTQTLQLEPWIKKMAEAFTDKQHALFLGRGTLYPIAMEGALKLKEISYIHAEAYPAGELKHGPLALVDGDMPIVVVAPDNSLLDKLKANMQEVKARGGQLFVFADRSVQIQEDKNTHVITLPHIDNILAPMLYVLPLQLLAYHVALIKGNDVDQPRNLAKSVTVE